MPTYQGDLIIIGGGPAGSAAAITAQKRGCQALLLEADTFPRHHVGESLVYLWQTFESLGVADQMDAAFQHKLGGTRIWGEDARPRYADFSHLPGQRNYSLQVERDRFDLILLRRAEEMGATVLQSRRVTSILWDGERAVGVTYRCSNGRSEEARGSIVIDASGRRSLVARHLGLQVLEPFYPDLAVYGYFRNSRRLDGDHEGDVLIETVPMGWIWFIPLRSGEVSVGLVTDQLTRQLVRQKGIAQFFQDGIAQTTMIAGLLGQATLATGPIATASYGYTSKRYAGPGWMLAGDAAFFTDPMWATGVGNALSNGVLAGASVAAVRDGRVQEQAAIRYYHKELSGIVESIDATIKFVYGCNKLYPDSPFWARRHQYLDEYPPPMEKVATDFGPSISRLIARVTGVPEKAKLRACP